MDLVLWRACQHTQHQRIWIPSTDWGQALTHDTDTYTNGGSTRLQQAHALADPNNPEKWEQASAPDPDTALRATSLHTPGDDLPPPNFGQRAAPAGGLVYRPQTRTLLRSVRSIPRPTTKCPMGPQGLHTMLARGTTRPRAVREPATPDRVLRGILEPGDAARARALAQITSGWAGYD